MYNYVCIVWNHMPVAGTSHEPFSLDSPGEKNRGAELQSPHWKLPTSTLHTRTEPQGATGTVNHNRGPRGSRNRKPVTMSFTGGCSGCSAHGILGILLQLSGASCHQLDGRLSYASIRGELWGMVSSQAAWLVDALVINNMKGE